MLGATALVPETAVRMRSIGDAVTLSRHGPRVHGVGTRPGRVARAPTAEEVDAAIMRQPAKMDRWAAHEARKARERQIKGAKHG